MTDPALAPGLYVAATPIGNLGDVSERLKAVLGGVAYVYCEDTRVTGRLLQAIGVKAKLRRYDDHAGAGARPAIIELIEGGAAIALVSDAGTPLIADPGFKLVRELRERGLPVFTVPGPSAIISALSIAGVPTDRFTFRGFMPAKAAGREREFATIEGRDETIVWYDTGPRLAATLSALTEALGDRPVVLARELTKLHEEVVGGTAAALAARYREAVPKGECVLILPAEETGPPSLEKADPLMAAALGTMRLKDAAAEVARKTGLSKRELYQRWLAKER